MENLVESIVLQEEEAADIFAAAISQKVAEALEARKAEIASNLFGEKAEQVDEAIKGMSAKPAAASKAEAHPSLQRAINHAVKNGYKATLTNKGNDVLLHHEKSGHKIEASYNSRSNMVNFSDHDSGISGNDDADDFNHTVKSAVANNKKNNKRAFAEDVEPVDEAMRRGFDWQKAAKNSKEMEDKGYERDGPYSWKKKGSKTESDPKAKKIPVDERAETVSENEASQQLAMHRTNLTKMGVASGDKSKVLSAIKSHLAGRKLNTTQSADLLGYLSQAGGLNNVSASVRNKALTAAKKDEV
jgi:hypothetical protein